MSNSTRHCSPQLRIAVTSVCNFHCFYCRPGGEGWHTDINDILSREEISFFLNVSAEVGYGFVKFTGGEPLLREDIIELVNDAAKCQGIEDVQLVTNGTLLAEKAAMLRSAGLSSITISLDAVKPELFAKMRGGRIDQLLEGIKVCKTVGIPIRINMVVARQNFTEIPAMMAMAVQHNASLKLLDLVNLYPSGHDDQWARDFIPFSQVHNLLKQMGAKYVGMESTPGGIGSATQEYRMPDGLQVVVKDAMFGTCYVDRCRDCPKYPCQDAVISIRLTHDGYIKKCLIRDDNLIPTRHLLEERNRVNLSRILSDLLNEYRTSKFIPRAWNPSLAFHKGK